MMKNLFAVILSVVILVGAAVEGLAADNGRVILDLTEDNKEIAAKDNIPTVIGLGAEYWQDVKEYDELLDGENIDKDFTADIMAKHPDYDEQKAKNWQKYVKKGIKTYRLYKDIKQKIINWIMDYEMPLVVDDDQYEMGESEPYIESDKPMVIHDFKKIIAYSNDKRDQLAIQEKYARDYGIERPSEKILKYKKALLNKDWGTLLGFDLNEILKKFYPSPEGKSDIDEQGVASVILTQFDGVGKDGKISGSIEIDLRKNGFVLLNEYNNFEELKIDFDKSENIKNINTGFVLPVSIEAENEKNIVGYASSFPIYFSAEAKDVKQAVKIKANVVLNFCLENNCQKIQLNPETELKPKEKIKETLFASHIKTLAKNVPMERNAKNFEFKSLIVEENAETERFLKLEIESDDASKTKVFIWGKEARYFAAPQMKIDGDEVSIKFKILDNTFDPLAKDITFWCATNGNNQYIHTMKIEKIVSETTLSLFVLIEVAKMALLGGLLLNLMPFGLVVLAYKILELTKFGRQNKEKIRKTFMGNTIGNLGSFIVMACVIIGAEINGYNLSWEMQLNNVYFVAIIIWMLLWLWLYIIGLLNSKLYDMAIGVNKIGLAEGIKSGVITSLLAVLLGGPYIGNAYNLATSYGMCEVWGVIVLVGVGMVIPYAVITAWSRVVMNINPGEWIKKLKFVLGWVVVLAIVLLLNRLEDLTSASEKWWWIGYLMVVGIIVALGKVSISEADKIADLKTSLQVKQIVKNILLGITALIVLGSILNIGSKVFINDIPVVSKEINKKIIDGDVSHNRKVLVKVNANWCWWCRINNAMVFDTAEMDDELQRNNVKIVDIDWTDYDEKTFKIMQNFGRMGPPFYILFSKKFPKGIVLPEIVSIDDLKTFIEM